MDGESSTSLGRHLLPMIGRPRRPRGRVGSLDPGVRARAVNLVGCGHQKAKAASRELAAIMVKESPPLYCFVLCSI